MQGDLGPEGIIYISPEQSPIDKGLIVMANEVSATISVYQINNDALGLEERTAQNEFKVYPNPVNNGMLFLSRPADVVLYDISGRKVAEKKEASFLNVDGISKGVYLLQTADGTSRKVIME